jgi:hypothetical protein
LRYVSLTPSIMLGQATSHLALREELKRLINRRRRDNAQFSWFDDKNSVAFFRFTVNNVADGIAVRIFTYGDPALSDLENTRIITQAKKRGEDGEVSGNGTSPTDQWPMEVSFEELKARFEAGEGTQRVIHANESFAPWSDLSDILVSDVESMGAMGYGPSLKDLGHEQPKKKKAEREEKKQPTFSKSTVEMRSTLDSRMTPRLKRASPQDLAAARKVVKNAMEESSRLNTARLASPQRNRYGLKPGTVVGESHVSATANQGSPPPLLQINDTVADAAALVAEADAVASTGRNMTRRAVASSGTYWMGSLSRKGSVPWGNDPKYNVFRNVLDYGAVGDGVTVSSIWNYNKKGIELADLLQDDTKAITAAMTNGTRCGKGCNGSTTKNAIVYFPPGKYLISSTIAMPFGTQVIGDANDRPELLASKSFIGLGVLSTDEYTGGGTGTDGLDQETYVNTANFYRQIRNVIIDITQVTAGTNITCVHYQVAQATSMQNVELRAGPKQRGMFAENGSGGQISDVTFTGGDVGLYGGNQQFTAQRLTFNGCTTGVQVIWDWGWVWKSVTMTNVKVGFKFVSDDGSGNIGSFSILDSSFTNVGTVVVIAPPSSKPGSGSTGVALENVALSGVTAAVADTAGKTLLSGSAAVVDEWALGPIYEGSSTARSFSQGGKIGSYRRHSTLLDSKGAYFERPRPQYEDRPVGDFVHLKDMGAAGDGSTDDTAAFQAALYASTGRVLFVDAGSYILTSTVTVPPGSKIVGETWSQLVASGSYFADAM